MYDTDLSDRPVRSDSLQSTHDKTPSHVNAIAVVVFDDRLKELTIARANRSFLRLTSAFNGAGVGSPLAPLFAPDDWPMLRDQIWKCFERECATAGTTDVRRGAGKSARMLFEASTLIESGSMQIECLLVLRTLVEQIAVATGLDDVVVISPSRSETTRVGSWTIGHGPQFAMRCTPEMLDIFGVSKQELEQNALAPMSRCHPEDRERIESAMHLAIGQRQNVEFEHRILLPSGEVRWVYARVTVSKEPGAQHFALGLVFDITDRVRAETALAAAEQRFHAAAEASLDGLAILRSRRDKSGGIVDFEIAALNQRASELLVRERDAVIGIGLCELFPRIRSEGHFNGCVDVVRTRVPFQRTIQSRSGELQLDWCHIQVVPVGDGIAISLRDVSHEMRLEEELAQSRRLESVGRLASSVAHDFNNMLSVICSLTSMVHDALPVDSPEREDLAESLKATSRAGELTRRLLAFSRQQVLAPAAVIPSAVLSNLEAIIRVIVGNKTRVVMNLDRGLKEIWIDAGQLEQAIVNLVTNARDAMPNGGTLRLESALAMVSERDSARFAGLAPGDYCAFRIADTGVGIDPETQSHIFEPFFTTKAPQHGMGLGLASVFGFVKQSGGHIQVNSDVGRGTTITMLLPYATERQRSRPPSRPTNDAPHDQTPASILLLEHDDAVCRTMQRILMAKGYVVIAANSVSDALDLIGVRGTTIDLLVTDTIPPQPDGVTILAKLLNENPDVGLLSTSGIASAQDTQTLHFDLGAVSLARPVTPELLLARAREALAISRLAQSSRGRAMRDLGEGSGDDASPDWHPPPASSRRRC